MNKLINQNVGPQKDLVDNYQNLVNAIILSGANEYRTVRRRLDRLNNKLIGIRKNTIEYDSAKKDISKTVDDLHILERFFKTSEWFDLLPNLTGEYILINLEAEFNDR